MNRFGPPDAVASDRWREGELRDGLDLAGIPSAAFVSRGQGYKDGGEDVRTFRRACLTGKVVPVVSLLMRAAMREAVTVSDAAGNSKLAKHTEGGRRLTRARRRGGGGNLGRERRRSRAARHRHRHPSPKSPGNCPT